MVLQVPKFIDLLVLMYTILPLPTDTVPQEPRDMELPLPTYMVLQVPIFTELPVLMYTKLLGPMYIVLQVQIFTEQPELTVPMYMLIHVLSSIVANG